MDYDTPRFRRSFVGYDRAAVDAEFDRLLSQVDDAMDKNDELRREIQDLKEERKDLEYSKRALEEERSSISRERASLAESVTTITGKVAELETNLSSAKVANEALQNKIDAAASEKNELQLRLDTVQERNRELTLRERQFDEIEKSVSSIMSVTKRATDRLFQKSVENQENVIRIAGDAAQEAALIRADLTSARDDMNVAFDELQDRIDKIDASLTGAVHKLVAIKHDSGLKPRNADATIESEVERLLSLRAGEVDYSDGKGYAVPVLGPYSAKFISDAAKKVNSGEIDGHPASENYAASAELPHAAPKESSESDSKSVIEVKKTFPGLFTSTDESIREANKLMDEADAAVAAGEEDERPRKAAVPTLIPAPQPVPTAAPTVPYTQPIPTSAPYVPQSNPMPTPTAPYVPPTYNPYQPQPYSPPQYAPQTRANPIGFGHRYDMSEQEEINPYSGEHFEKVDLSTLQNQGGSIVMDTPELQYIQQAAQTQGYAYDAPAVNLSMSQPNAAAAVEYAGVAPTFVPNMPVISANTVPVQQQSAQPGEAVSEPKPTAKRVTVTRRVVSADPQEKVKIIVRHSK